MSNESRNSLLGPAHSPRRYTAVAMGAFFAGMATHSLMTHPGNQQPAVAVAPEADPNAELEREFGKLKNHLRDIIDNRLRIALTLEGKISAVDGVLQQLKDLEIKYDDRFSAMPTLRKQFDDFRGQAEQARAIYVQKLNEELRVEPAEKNGRMT